MFWTLHLWLWEVQRGNGKNSEPKRIGHESKIIEDDPLNCIHYYLDVKSIGTIEEDYVMPVTYCDDHDWENNTTYDLENLFGTNFENDDIDNCYTVGNIHVSSKQNVERRGDRSRGLFIAMPSSGMIYE